jgi:uncharacterized phage protein gp47/JayE
MQLSLQNFSTLVQNMAAAVQSAASQLLDLSVGSTLRALLEANASIGLWMQWLILQVLQATRAATSSGPDLDSWMADMTLTRLPAVTATGGISLARFTALQSALVPVGAMVRTADGSQTFAVTLDPSNVAWDAAQNGYVVAAGIASILVPVAAMVAGSAGNVQAGSIRLLASAIPGIDTVTNAAAFQNGMDAESDAAFRARFQSFFGSRSRATSLSVGYAIISVQQGLNYTIQENVDASGSTCHGSFIVTVDDGSGSPSTTLLTTVNAAVDAVRPVGSVFAVLPPTVITADISLTIVVSVGTAKMGVIGPVANAIANYINALPIGATLPLTRLAQLAYAASTAVTNVTQVTINGAALDLTAPLASVIKAGVVSVN